MGYRALAINHKALSALVHSRTLSDERGARSAWPGFLVCQVASRYLIAAENALSRGIETDQTSELAAPDTFGNRSAASFVQINCRI